MKKIAFYLLMCWMAGSLCGCRSPLVDKCARSSGAGEKGKQTGSHGFHRLRLVLVVQKIGCGNIRQTRVCRICEEEPGACAARLPELQTAIATGVEEGQPGELQTKYKIEGFPTLIVIKPDGTVVWQQVGYLAGGPSALISAVDKAKQS